MFISSQLGQFCQSTYEVSDLKKGELFRHSSDTKRGIRTQDVKGLLLRLDDSFLAAVLLDFARPFMVQQRSFPRAMPQQIGISKCLSAIHSLPQLEKASCCWHEFGSPHTCQGRNLGAFRKPHGFGIAGKKTNRRRRDEGTIDQRMQKIRCTSDVVRYMEKMQAGRAHHRHWLCLLGFIVF